MTITDIAKVCHEANRALCESQDDPSQVPWDQAPEWQRTSAENGVHFHVENPDAGASASHENWLKEKHDTGWVYGDVKDVEAKTHPCMVPYGQLPVHQQRKDVLFHAIVHSLRPLLEAE